MSDKPSAVDEYKTSGCLPGEVATVILKSLIVAARPSAYFRCFMTSRGEKMRRHHVLRIVLISCIFVVGAFVTHTSSQSQRRRVPQRETPQKSVKPATTTPTPAAAPKATPEASPEPEPEPELQDVDTLKIATDLVTVPVIATTRDGNYIADLRQEEFNVSENGVKQEVAFFATVSAPFHVVLMLDTSGSTREKIGLIRDAAISFVDQLQTADRVKVISFDDQVRDLSEFTNNRALLRTAINKTTPGRGTKLYDAFELALSSVRNIKGRKAIVLFSDGVDYHSDRASFDGTLHWLDEESVIVYPIRYDTREATARLMREQIEEQQGPQLPTIGVIRAPTSGTTAPTFPSDDPGSVPTSGTNRKTGPFGLPSASEILRRRSEAEREQRERENGRNTGRYPDPTNSPGRDPRDPLPGPTDPRDPRTDPRNDPRSSGRRAEDESIHNELDRLYLMADSYLLELANKSGGQVLRADTLGSLPAAFAKIAAELRTQYAIGYYPIDKKHDGTYRKIKVSTTRKNTSVRARPGYRAPRGG